MYVERFTDGLGLNDTTLVRRFSSHFSSTFVNFTRVRILLSYLQINKYFILQK